MNIQAVCLDIGESFMSLPSMRIVFVAATLVSVLCLAPASAQQDAHPELKSFEFLGCSGDWDGKLGEPEVWRVVADGQITFLTHSVATCGLSGRSPIVTGSQTQLSLSYELYSPTNVVIMCDCEYWAKFSFGGEAYQVTSVTVGGEKAVLRGDWPER
ncbi:MAG: hypothetical protein KDI78_12920 [Xanthomonadales bacterium]|nr:hypothetical protein [Xanthomonadales bacterium]